MFSNLKKLNTQQEQKSRRPDTVRTAPPSPVDPFPSSEALPQPVQPPVEMPVEAPVMAVERPEEDKSTTSPSRQSNPPQSVQKDSKPISKKASTLASYHTSVVETIRKTVKDVGREVTFVRLSREEKQQLADIAYTYKRQGVKTSENEISRIAINYMLEDYHANGQESLLAKVIAALLVLQL